MWSCCLQEAPWVRCLVSLRQGSLFWIPAATDASQRAPVELEACHGHPLLSLLLALLHGLCILNTVFVRNCCLLSTLSPVEVVVVTPT